MQVIKDISALMTRAASLTDYKTHPHTIRLFRAVISLWVIVYTLILLPAAGQFYSASSYIAPLPIKTSFVHWMYLLNMKEYMGLYPLFIAGQLFFAVFAGLSIFPRLSSALLFFFTINLDNRAYVTMDGGNNLIHLLLFFLIFASPAPARRPESLGASADNLTSNLAFYMCRIQVVLVYATAGLLKVAGPLWTKGIALYYTMSVVDYGSPVIARLLSHFPILIVIATYGTLLFQISFPYLIWNRKTRPIYMAVGTALHLQISLIMGLFMFGLAMCSSYFCFYTDEQARSVLNRIQFKKGEIHAMA